jgi:hypothetical protein
MGIAEAGGMTMGVLQLNIFETHMARMAEVAELCDFTAPEFKDANRIELRADAIRALLLGLPVIYDGETVEKVVELRGAGLRLKKPAAEAGIEVLQAHITGALDLDHASRADGASLPHLALLACVFEEPINLKHARLRGINLAGSHLSHICGQHSVIEGSVDLSGLRATENGPKGMGDKGQCWVDFSGAQIGATFRATGAQLVAPIVRSPEELEVELPHYALELDHAHLGGSLDLRNGFEADGGVTLELAVIKGHVRARGIRLKAGEWNALVADNAEIRGDVDFRPRVARNGDTIVTVIEGDVVMYSAFIAGYLMLDGVWLDGDLYAIGVSSEGPVFLSAWNGKKDGEDHTYLFKSKQISLYGVKFKRDLVMSGAQLQKGMNAGGAVIDGAVVLQACNGKLDGKNEVFPFTCGADVWLAGTKITGNLEMNGARLEGKLFADNAVIEGDVYLSVWNDTKDIDSEAIPFTAKDDVLLYGFKTTGDLVMSGAQLKQGLNVRNSEIGGGIYLRSVVQKKVKGKQTKILFTADAPVTLWGAVIGRNLNTWGAKFKKGIELRDIEVGGSSYFFPRMQTYLFYGKRRAYLWTFSYVVLASIISCMAGTAMVFAANGGRLEPDSLWISSQSAPGVMVIDKGTIDTGFQAEAKLNSSLLLAGEKPCGAQIDPVYYAIDLFIPLIDLKQEARCLITSAPKAWNWRLLFSAYSLVGWGLVSWLLFTITSIIVSSSTGRRGG